MKKLFISQPMRGKSDKEILKEREIALKEAKELFDNEEIEVIDSFFDDFDENAKPLNYLAKSIEYLADADVAFFAKGWQEARGCKIEHECAKQYDIPCIYYIEKQKIELNLDKKKN